MNLAKKFEQHLRKNGKAESTIKHQVGDVWGVSKNLGMDIGHGESLFDSRIPVFVIRCVRNIHEDYFMVKPISKRQRSSLNAYYKFRSTLKLSTD